MVFMQSGKIKIFIELLVFLALTAFFIFIAREKVAAFYYNRGCNYYESGLYREAIGSFNNSLKFYPQSSKTHYSLANAYDFDNQEEKAMEAYKKAIKLDAHFLWAYEALLDIYLRRGNFQQANVLLKEADINLTERQKFKDLDNLNQFKQATYFINKGIEAYLDGNKSEGYKALNTALNLNPDFVLTRYSLGYFYYVDLNYDRAMEMLKKASEIDSEFLFTHKLIANIYFSKKDFDKAIEEYQKALLKDQGDPVILNNLGLSYMHLENYDRAVEYLERTVNLDPHNLNFRYSLASLYRDMGRDEDSLLQYKIILEKKPDFPNVYNDIADIDKLKGRMKEALANYQKEIDVCNQKLLGNPNDLMLLNSLAYAYNGIGQYARAQEIIGQVLAARPQSREAHLTLAAIQKNIGEYQASLASLEKANKLSSQKQPFIQQKIDDLKEELKDFGLGNGKARVFETVYLKNGRKFEGVVVGQTKDRVILEINIGNSRGNIMILNNDIERIAKK